MPKRAGPFLQLDYLYTPSDNVAADVRYFTEVLGGKLAFAIDAMGTRVAKIELTAGPPHVLLTDHLEGERPILVYRVAGSRWGPAARSCQPAVTASPCTS